MIINLNLTEDHLKLVSFLLIDNDDDTVKINKNELLKIQSHVLDDVALILGLKDKAIQGTECDSDGAAYPQEIEDYILSTYNYVKDNLYYIETLLHQFVTEGVKAGTYKANDADLIWEKI